MPPKTLRRPGRCGASGLPGAASSAERPEGIPNLRKSRELDSLAARGLSCRWEEAFDSRHPSMSLSEVSGGNIRRGCVKNPDLEAWIGAESPNRPWRLSLGPVDRPIGIPSGCSKSLPDPSASAGNIAERECDALAGAIRRDHFQDQVLKTCFGLPAELRARLGRVAHQQMDFRGAK